MAYPGGSGPPGYPDQRVPNTYGLESSPVQVYGTGQAMPQPASLGQMSVDFDVALAQFHALSLNEHGTGNNSAHHQSSQHQQFQGQQHQGIDASQAGLQGLSLSDSAMPHGQAHHQTANGHAAALPLLTQAQVQEMLQYLQNLRAENAQLREMANSLHQAAQEADRRANQLEERLKAAEYKNYALSIHLAMSNHPDRLG